MNKERMFTLERADAQARMWRKIRQVSCGNFLDPQAFPWLVHDVLVVSKVGFQ